MASNRICVIGAGPSGLSTLYTFVKAESEGKTIPEIVCYEKQDTICGMWNYTWRTGTDKYGEQLPNSMYQNLWSNGPKELSEYPDYTFDEHFGHAIPSMPPRPIIRDYLEGRAKKWNLEKYILTNHIVKRVVYNEETNDFSIDVKNLVSNSTLLNERFSHVIVCIGHYSVPNSPDIPGMDSFPNRIINVHDLRDMSCFKGLNVLVIGSSYSAEDVILQSYKYGAKTIAYSWRTKPMEFKLPESISAYEMVTKIDGKTVTFKNGKSEQFDVIVLCTGYLHHYPFLADNLHLNSPNTFYPTDLYKGVVYLNGGGNRLFYIGAQNTIYTFIMYEVQAFMVRDIIQGDVQLPSRSEMAENTKVWIKRLELCTKCMEFVKYQTDYIMDLCNLNQYPYTIDGYHLMVQWYQYKQENILQYRDHCFKSLHTGTISTLHKDMWIDAFC